MIPNWTSKCCLSANTDRGSFLTIQTILGILGPNGLRKSTPDQGHARRHFSSFGEKVRSIKRPQPSSSTGGLRRTEIRYWFPLPITVGVCLTGPPHLFYLQAKKQRGSPKSGKCHETCQSSWSNLDRQKIGQLSGGQFQRILIAAAWSRSECHLLDEPLRGLSLAKHHHADTQTLNKKKARSSWSSHHDLSKVPAYFDQSSSFTQPDDWKNRGNYQGESACSLWAWSL